MSKRNHLPLYGVGPVIVYGQFILTAVSIILPYLFDFRFPAGGALLACTGAVFLANNLLLLAVPVVCWLYMTLFLIKTEEKWLRELYGQEYLSYCEKVNRCIPWFPKGKRL